MYSSTLIGIFLFGFLIFNAFGTVADEAATADVSEDEFIVIIDPGHGGEDSGAVANSLLEKDINLDISLRLRDMLRASGIAVKMTRDSDLSIYDTSAGTIREKKVSDLKNRVEIANSGKNNVLVSIHQNKFEDGKYSGAQMFYSVNNEKSKDLAESIRKSVTGLIQQDNNRELKKAGSGIYLLNKTTVPSVVVECGFLSNTKEAKMLSDEEYKSKMAFAIYCGILEYRNNR